MLKRVKPLCERPQVLAFLPALVLASFWLGGEVFLVLTALGVPVFLAFAGHPQPKGPWSGDVRLEDILDSVLKTARCSAPQNDENRMHPDRA
jgi:hypothetical protein